MGKIGRRKDPLREKSLQIAVKIAESLRRRQCVGGLKNLRIMSKLGDFTIHPVLDQF